MSHNEVVELIKLLKITNPIALGLSIGSIVGLLMLIWLVLKLHKENCRDLRDANIEYRKDCIHIKDDISTSYKVMNKMHDKLASLEARIEDQEEDPDNIPEKYLVDRVKALYIKNKIGKIEAIKMFRHTIKAKSQLKYAKVMVDTWDREKE